MGEALTDFIKNASLFTVLHLFISIVVLLVGFVVTILTRSRAGGTWFLLIGIIPALSGILAWRFENDIANHRRAMFGLLDDAGVAAVHREALVDLIVGFVVAAVVLSLRMWRQRNNRKASIK